MSSYWNDRVLERMKHGGKTPSAPPAARDVNASRKGVPSAPFPDKPQVEVTFHHPEWGQVNLVLQPGDRTGDVEGLLSVLPLPDPDTGLDPDLNPESDPKPGPRRARDH